MKITGKALSMDAVKFQSSRNLAYLFSKLTATASQALITVKTELKDLIKQAAPECFIYLEQLQASTMLIGWSYRSVRDRAVSGGDSEMSMLG